MPVFGVHFMIALDFLCRTEWVEVEWSDCSIEYLRVQLVLARRKSTFVDTVVAPSGKYLFIVDPWFD